MERATDATVATFRLDPGRDEKQNQARQGFIVPSDRRAPGLAHEHRIAVTARVGMRLVGSG